MFLRRCASRVRTRSPGSCPLCMACACLVVLALGACARGGIERTAAAAADLSPEASVYVAVPPDGRFADYVYPGSGRRLAELIGETFAPHLRAVALGAEPQTPTAALASARDGGFTYLAVPRIVRWEDRASAWSGLPDAAEIRLALIETRSGDAGDIAVIVGRRKPVAEDEGADTHPEDLLVGPLAAYAEAVFADPRSGATQAAR